MLLNLSKRTDPARHPLLRKTSPATKIAVIVVSTNRGFVGPMNSQLLGTVNTFLKSLLGTEATPSTVLLGTKARALRTVYGHEVFAEFPKEDLITDARHVRPVAKLAIDGFRAGEYDRVMIAYVHYYSSLSQRPRLRQILPLDASAIERGYEGIFERGEREALIKEEAAEEHAFEYTFEPNPDDVLESLLPRLVESQIYRAILETNASEHAARMLSMRNASDAAGELIDDLTLTFNQVRQAAITQDLSEISASRAALEG
jgi:F-type H+-transporting ATPase subunit gamma